MTARKFNFSIPVLIRQGEILYSSLIDELYAAPMAERLNEAKDSAKNNFAIRFRKKLDLLGSGKVIHAGKQGEVGKLTMQQAEDLKEVGRLSALARRSARLAFRGEKVRLHKEFLVGINKPGSLAARLDRARAILASCLLYSTELKNRGWLSRDADLLAAAIERLDESGIAQVGAADQRTDMSEEKIRAANDVFDDCLNIQNAARLEFPVTRLATGTARARFLLDEFPPRGRAASTPDAKPAPVPAPVPVERVAVLEAPVEIDEPGILDAAAGSSIGDGNAGLPMVELVLKNGKKRAPRDGRS